MSAWSREEGQQGEIHSSLSNHGVSDLTHGRLPSLVGAANEDVVERRLIILLLAVIGALVLLTPRINLWMLRDECLARHGQWDPAQRRCELDRRDSFGP